MNDYYETLGIPRNASKDEVKRAYRKLAHQFHPDKSGGDDARFKEINEAYQVLGDDNKRQQYDRFGTTFQSGQGAGGFGGQQYSNADFGDIFEDLFSGFAGFGSKSRGRQRGRDISIGIDISFSDGMFGTNRSVLLPKTALCDVCGGNGAEPGSKLSKCDVCRGTGTVRETRKSMFGSFTSLTECSVCNGKGESPEKVCSSCSGAGVFRKQETIDFAVPPGINDGEVIKITGMGEAVAGGESGDVYVRVHVLPDPVFRRDGSDLIMDLTLMHSLLLLGGTQTVDTLEGAIEVRIPELSRAGDLLRIRGKGVPRQRGGRGDLLIRLVPKVPKKLSSRAKKILADLSEEGL
jgi:molecular chaperone DnaJ